MGRNRDEIEHYTKLISEKTFIEHRLVRYNKRLKAVIEEINLVNKKLGV